MKKSHEVLKQSIARCGAKSVAAEMGLSQSMIYKWCQPAEGPESSGVENPLDRLLQICRLTGDDGIIDWLCRQTDSFRVRNPEAIAEGNISQAVMDNTQNILKEFSDMLEAVTQSYANGQRIDAEESSRIRKEWDELKSVAEQFVCSCESGRFNRTDKMKGVS